MTAIVSSLAWYLLADLNHKWCTKARVDVFQYWIHLPAGLSRYRNILAICTDHEHVAEPETIEFTATTALCQRAGAYCVRAPQETIA